MLEHRSLGPVSTPQLDVLARPQSDAAAALVDHRPRKVVISAQVGRDTVVVRQTEDLGDFTC